MKPRPAHQTASTRLTSFKYGGAGVLVAVRGHLRLPVPGVYGVRLATSAPPARLAVTVGQRRLDWRLATATAAAAATAANASSSPGATADVVREAVLQAPTAGELRLCS